MRRFLCVLFTSIVLWTLLACANHAIAAWHIYLFVGGLYVTYTALEFPLFTGMAASVAAGIVCDANSGVSFGTHALLFAAAHACIFHLRERLPADQTAGRVAIALLANFGIFLALSFSQMSRLPDPSSAWPRLGSDLICSQIALGVIGPWYFALQARTLVLARAESERLA